MIVSTATTVTDVRWTKGTGKEAVHKESIKIKMQTYNHFPKAIMMENVPEEYIDLSTSGLFSEKDCLDLFRS